MTRPAGLPPFDYIDLRDLEDDSQREALLQSFYTHLYADAFPSPQEREGPDVWRPLLWGGERDSAPLELHILLAVEREAAPLGRRVYGGLVFEIYRQSACALFTYLVVDPAPALRRQGLGRRQVSEARRVVDKRARALGLQVQAVFGEVHDPAWPSPEDRVMDPWERIEALQRLGARCLDIPYVQPPLGRKGQPSHHLMLFAFTSTGQQAAGGRAEEGAEEYGSPSVPAATVVAFLRDYYRANDVAEPERAEYAAPMWEYLHDLQRRDAAVPWVTYVEEQPTQSFGRFAIAFHFAMVEARPIDQAVDAEPFATFERDILAYAYRERRGIDGRAPLQSRVLLPHVPKTVEIRFPVVTAYRSEGDHYRLWCAGQAGRVRRRRLRLLASRTDFRSGDFGPAGARRPGRERALGEGRKVFHLVFFSDRDGGYRRCSEYDLIKLAKLCNDHEDSDVEAQARFAVLCARHADSDDESPVACQGCREYRDFDSFAAAALSGAGELSPIRTCTIQLFAEATSADAWARLNRYLGLLASDRPEAMRQLRPLLEDGADPALERQAKAVGGMLSAIFDFGRIDYRELCDVLEPLDWSDHHVICLQKAVLLSLADMDRVFDLAVRRSHIGMSPYLLIPHAVLLHNEMILDDVERVVQEADRSTDKRVLGRARVRAEAGLKSYLTPNVFHYHAERRLFERGCEERGLDRKAATLERRLEQLVGALMMEEQKGIGWQALDSMGKYLSQLQGREETTFRIRSPAELTPAALPGDPGAAATPGADATPSPSARAAPAPLADVVTMPAADPMTGVAFGVVTAVVVAAIVAIVWFNRVT